jgi:hypothetical protein
MLVVSDMAVGEKDVDAVVVDGGRGIGGIKQRVHVVVVQVGVDRVGRIVAIAGQNVGGREVDAAEIDAGGSAEEKRKAAGTHEVTEAGLLIF